MRALCCMILILAALLSSALARPRAYDGYDEEENAWPISDTRKYLLGQYENENKYKGFNTEEANIERHYPGYFTCFADRKCRAPVPPIDCCYDRTNYYKNEWGVCCPCSGLCPTPYYNDQE